MKRLFSLILTILGQSEPLTVILRVSQNLFYNTICLVEILLLRLSGRCFSFSESEAYWS